MQSVEKPLRPGEAAAALFLVQGAPRGKGDWNGDADHHYARPAFEFRVRGSAHLLRQHQVERGNAHADQYCIREQVEPALHDLTHSTPHPDNERAK
jgi:hypothetical protein